MEEDECRVIFGAAVPRSYFGWTLPSNNYVMPSDAVALFWIALFLSSSTTDVKLSIYSYSPCGMVHKENSDTIHPDCYRGNVPHPRLPIPLSLYIVH